MSDLETKTTSPTSPVEAAGEALTRTDRRLNLLFVCVVLNSLMLTAILAFWSIRAGRELDMLRPRGQQAVQNARELDRAIADFQTRLSEYARTHPDFLPIASKYGIVPSSASPSNAASPAPSQNK